jgi:hypothetical protein
VGCFGGHLGGEGALVKADEEGDKTRGRRTKEDKTKRRVEKRKKGPMGKENDKTKTKKETGSGEPGAEGGRWRKDGGERGRWMEAMRRGRRMRGWRKRGR